MSHKSRIAFSLMLLAAILGLPGCSPDSKPDSAESSKTDTDPVDAAKPVDHLATARRKLDIGDFGAAAESALQGTA